MAARASKAAFRPLQGRRSFEEIADQIRDQVKEGHLREGDRLPAERDMAAALGVSRNTVREALRGLEHAGLITQKTGATGGAFVSAGSGRAIRVAFDDLVRLGAVRPADLTQARIILGREVTRLACERHDEADLRALRDNVARTAAAAEAGDMALRVRTSLEFYDLLARSAKNPVLTVLTGVLTDMTMEFVRIIGMTPNAFVVSHRRRMLLCLERRDADAAVAEMDEYLRTTMQGYFERLP